MWSDSGPSLSHGGPWKDHKYIAIRNGRYIYPNDATGSDGTSYRPPKKKKTPAFIPDVEDPAKNNTSIRPKHPSIHSFYRTPGFSTRGSVNPPPTKGVQNPNKPNDGRRRDKGDWKNDPKFKEAEKDYEKRIKDKLGVTKEPEKKERHKVDSVTKGWTDPYRTKNKADGGAYHGTKYPRGMVPWSERRNDAYNKKKSSQKFKEKRNETKNKKKKNPFQKAINWIKGSEGKVSVKI